MKKREENGDCDDARFGQEGIFDKALKKMEAVPNKLI